MYDPYMPLRNVQQQDRILTITGIGKVTTQPDTAIIQLSVRTENTELTTAQQENAEIMTTVIQALHQLGIPDEQIQTVSFTINPRYDYMEGEQIFRGYEVVNTISVKITNFSAIGHMIDVAVETGVNEVVNIAFSHSDPQQFEQQALQLALQNAQAKAQAMAESLRVQLNPIPTKITEQTQEQTASFKTFTLSEQATTTPIEPGQLTITAAVRVQYEY